MTKRRIRRMFFLLFILSGYLHASGLDLSYRSETMSKLDIVTIQTRASTGDVEAEFELSIRYIRGEGIKKDKKAGIAELQKCVSEGGARCGIALGDLSKVYECQDDYNVAIKSSDPMLSELASEKLNYRSYHNGAADFLNALSGGMSAATTIVAANTNSSDPIQDTLHQQQANINATYEQIQQQKAAQQRQQTTVAPASVQQPIQVAYEAPPAPLAPLPSARYTDPVPQCLTSSFQGGTLTYMNGCSFEIDVYWTPMNPGPRDFTMGNMPIAANSSIQAGISAADSERMGGVRAYACQSPSVPEDENNQTPNHPIATYRCHQNF